MKIGVSSYSFRRYMEATGATYTDVCSLAKQTGYDGIEFTDLLLTAQPAESVEALADIISAHCASLGLPILSYTVGADFMKEDRQAEVTRLKSCVDIAARLGAPLMRHDATWRREGDWRAVIREIAPAIREVTEYAAGKGIRTMTENHGYFIQDAERMEALIKAVGHPNYGWLVDIGNFACADEDSISAVKVAAPYAFHVHAKDFLIKPKEAFAPGDGWFPSRDGRHLRGTIVGHGVIPIPECVRILKEAGYDGYFSYEFEGLEDNLTAISFGLSYLRRVAEVG